MRKVSKTIILCFLFAIGACMSTIDVKSVGMETHSISTEEKASIIENIHLQIIQEDSRNTSIQCFDVSQDGMIALGSSSGGNKLIYVYDASGTFQYGFCFYCDGAYGIEFQGGNLGIYFLRGNVLVTYDSSGACVDVQKMADTTENYAIAKDLLNRTEKYIAGRHYAMERNMEFGNAYSRFVVTDELGIKTVLFDSTKSHSASQILFMLFLVGFLFAVIRGCVLKSMRDKRCT